MQVRAGEVTFLSLTSSGIVIHHDMIIEIDFLDMHVILLLFVMTRGRFSFLLSDLFIALRFVQLRNDTLVLLSYLLTSG